MNKLLIIDTETGGLEKSKSLLQIGMIYITVTDKKIEIIDEIDVKIKYKTYNISKKAEEVIRFNKEEHEKAALETSEAKQKIIDFVVKHRLQHTFILGQNIQFDVGFLETFFGKDYPFYRHQIDVKHIWCYLKLCNKIPNGLFNHLKDMSEYFEVNYKDAHDALEDCKITLKVFENLINLT